MTTILTSDVLIADVITQLEGNQKLQKLVDKYGLKRGGKISLTREQFAEFSSAIQGSPITIMPGGSSANTLTTMSKMLRGELEVNFLGVVGKGMYSQMIQDSLDESGISLCPKNLEAGLSPESAVSFVIVYPDGQRTIASYIGNAREIMKAEHVTNELVKSSDALLVGGTLWQKFDWEYADRLLEARWENNKELWLALPTQAKFGQDKAGHFQWLIPSANVVLSNEEELGHVYHTDPKSALYRLQQAFREHPVLEREGRAHGKKPVGFITLSENGAMVVTADEDPVHIPASPPEKIINTLGAGDTSFGGFLGGYVCGLPHVTSARIAMALAGEKLKVNGPRLVDPLRSLGEARPDLAAKLIRGRSWLGRVEKSEDIAERSI